MNRHVWLAILGGIMAGAAWHDLAAQQMAMPSSMAMPAMAPANSSTVAAPAPAPTHGDADMHDMQGTHDMQGMQGATQDGASRQPTAAGDGRAVIKAHKRPSHQAPTKAASGKAAQPPAQAAPMSSGVASMPGPPALPANDHVPPAPPRHAMPAMTGPAMVAAMQMNDRAWRGMLLAQRLEYSRSGGGDSSRTWDIEGWYGGDIDRLWLRSEGSQSHQGTDDARVELLWTHAMATFWDAQLGVRQDVGDGPHRQWLAAGIQGLAPDWFELQATLYAGPGGRSAARIEVSRDFLLTQRLILTPRGELNAYGKDDPRRQVRAGLSDAEIGLRLRYEVSRRFAPYLGVQWQRHLASPDALPWDRHESGHEFAWLVGVRLWF